MERPNRMAIDLVDEAIDFADELRVATHHLANDAVVLDFGVERAGGIEAGLLLAEIATGGLATVQTRVDTVDDVALTHVELATDHPALALLGCQLPGWPLTIEGERILCGGPAQLLREERESVERLDDIGAIDDGEADFAVLAVEADRLPGEAIAEEVATATGVPTSAVFVVAAPADSVAGGVAFAARTGALAVRRLVSTGFDPAEVRSVDASSPVAPLAPSTAEARARSMAAVRGGGRVHVVAESSPDDPRRLSSADPDHVVPAQVTLDVASGPTHVLGGVDEVTLAGDLGL